MLLTPETRDRLTNEHGLLLERASDDVMVRVPAASIIRNLPTREILPSLDAPRPLAIYRALPNRAAAHPAPSAADRLLFQGSPAEGWSLVGWRSKAEIRSDVLAPDGSPTLALTAGGPYGGQALVGPTFSTRGYTRLDFEVHGGKASNQPLRVSLRDAAGENIAQVAVDAYTEWGGIGAGVWRRVSIPLDALGGTDREVRGVQLLMNRRDPTPTIYLANIRLSAPLTPP
jgi:hypothetical protein